MYQDPLTRIAELESLIRQKDIQLSLNSKTEAELHYALQLAEEKATEHEQKTEELSAQLDKIRRMLYGNRSEKLRQQKAALEDKLNALEQKDDEHGERENDPQLPLQLRQPRKRRPLPAHLPREINRLEPAETCCPECGGRLEYLGEDSAEQLEILSAALKVINTIRKKHACVKCDCIVQAAAPSRPIERGIYAEKHLTGFRGKVLQVDDYAGYNSQFTLQRENGPPLKRAGCMAHARRKIDDIWINARTNPTLMQVMGLINELYVTEAEIRGLSAEYRLAVDDILKELIDEKQTTLSKKSRLSKAFTYIENHWDALCYYCQDGHVEIDNNAAERAIRTVAVGRKNWLFFGSALGGERGAMPFSLLGTCKLNGINPEAWLRYVLGVLPDWPSNRVNELLPWNVDQTSM